MKIMSKYGLSISERKQKFLEDCCGGSGGDMSADAPADSDMGMSETDPTDSVLDKALNKLKRRKKKNGS